MKKRKHTPEKTSREAKKAIVMNTAKRNPTPIVIAAVAVISATAVLGFFLLPDSRPTGGPQIAASPAAPSAEQGQVTHAVSRFDDGQARHFHYADASSGITINYFVLKSSDGVIRAAFDACDVCWPAGKGYYQEGDSMVCRNCGRRFDSVMVNEVQGGCNPAPLKRSVEGDQVVIRVEDLLEGRAYFDFSGKA